MIDKTRERFFHQVGWWWVVIVGYIISLSTMSTGARYFSLFLMTTGFCGMLSWPRVGLRRTADLHAQGSHLHWSGFPTQFLVLLRNDRLPSHSSMVLETSEVCKSAMHSKGVSLSLRLYDHRMGSYIWQSRWAPGYHQSMIIATCALVFATCLSFGELTLSKIHSRH